MIAGLGLWGWKNERYTPIQLLRGGGVMSDSMTLSDDPKKALHEIAGYLRSVSMGSNRAVWDTEESKEIIGYYQRTEWLMGLLEIADECDRIVLVGPA